ncbi:Predicted kinase, aminoglycoside phosphotransferase (APT) family [Sphingomonas laterariae]|uniref:Predicted kinase, aminoglycoside phosphotransferase (APT) family n=1 Tax=Edaphosphingomonas laterariae TaxID=861865 RepID=A0A239D4T2_9SPHN|nr:phosphotransferase family protein [Sphingomonas laterariae]SNS27526.1 Predicted kinase, aminoglycoside phosphotransferase (APT) family [Sphingomonas laterariae]
MPDTRSDPAIALAAAVRRRFGGGTSVENVVQATLGGSNRTLLFDLVEGGGTRRRLVSREETFTGEASPFLSPGQQFRLTAYVHAAGVPVPEPIFEYDGQDALGPGFVTAFVAGETLPRRLIERDDRAALLVQLAEALVRLHGLDVPPASTEPSSRRGASSQPIPSSQRRLGSQAAEAQRQQSDANPPSPDADDNGSTQHPLAFLADIPESGDPVAGMRLRLDALDEPHPALELGLRWLETHRPPQRPRALVHGDFRNGNFMVGQSGLAALLDWECSHLGSGVEDLGWLCTRSWRFGRNADHAGGFGTRDDLIAAYASAGGPRLDADEIRWWERFGLIRWAMFNVLQAHGFAHGRRSPAYAVCGRNTALMEYDLLMTLKGSYD